MNTKYHYIVMSQQDILLNQVFEEIFRERTSYYTAQKKIIDFWLLVSPRFIEEQKLSIKIKKTRFFVDKKDKILVTCPSGESKEFYAVIISTDEDYIRWLKLRLGYFEEIEDLNDKAIIPRATSNGVCGSLCVKENEKEPNLDLEIRILDLHPNIFKLASGNTDYSK